MDFLKHKLITSIVLFLFMFSVRAQTQDTQGDLLKAQAWLEENNVKESIIGPAAQQIKELKIFNQKRKEIPDFVFKALDKCCSKLQSLQIFYVKQGQFPPEFSSLGKKLKKLEMTYGTIDIFPEEFLQFENLETLNLTGNKITQLPTQLGKLTRLKNLNMSHNSLQAIQDDIIFPSLLEKLNLSNNQKLNNLPTSLEKLEHLQVLNTQKTQVEESIMLRMTKIINSKILKKCEGQIKSDLIKGLYPQEKYLDRKYYPFAFPQDSELEVQSSDFGMTSLNFNNQAKGNYIDYRQKLRHSSNGQEGTRTFALNSQLENGILELTKSTYWENEGMDFEEELTYHYNHLCQAELVTTKLETTKYLPESVILKKVLLRKESQVEESEEIVEKPKDVYLSTQAIESFIQSEPISDLHKKMFKRFKFIRSLQKGLTVDCFDPLIQQTVSCRQYEFILANSDFQVESQMKVTYSPSSLYRNIESFLVKVPSLKQTSEIGLSEKKWENLSTLAIHEENKKKEFTFKGFPKKLHSTDKVTFKIDANFPLSPKNFLSYFHPVEANENFCIFGRLEDDNQAHTSLVPQEKISPANYLKSTALYDYQNPKLQAIISEIKKKLPSSPTGPTKQEIVDQILKYISSHYTYNHSWIGKDRYNNTLYPASEILEKESFVCVQFSILFTALARGLGVPTRGMVGLSISGQDKFEGHQWVEISLDDQSWKMLEPQNHSLKEHNDVLYFPFQFFQKEFQKIEDASTMTEARNKLLELSLKEFNLKLNFEMIP